MLLAVQVGALVVATSVVVGVLARLIDRDIERRERKGG